MENRAHELNQYSLGVQVFGKKPNYNPSLDNIVRVTARQLRQKLGEYYSSEGASDPWVLEIPKGAYGPHVRPKAVAEVPEVSAPPEHRAPKHRRLFLTAICLLLGLTGWAAAAWIWLARPHTSPKPAYRPQPILADRDHSVAIVLDDPVLSRVWSMIGEMMTVDDISAGLLLDPKYYKTADGNYLRDMLGDNYFVHFSSVKALANLSEIAQSNSVEASPGSNCWVVPPVQRRKVPVSLPSRRTIWTRYKNSAVCQSNGLQGLRSSWRQRH